MWEASSYRSCSSTVDWQKWPDVEYPDVYNYLIETPSLYTKDNLKAYKSLDRYKFYTDGWISHVSVRGIDDTSNLSIFLATCLVHHSQSISATPLKPWVAMKKGGCILVAHCTCMVGLGEACSHIAGLLFTLEGNTRIKHQTSCTSLPCTWLLPSFQNISYEPIANISFSVSKISDIESNSSTSTNVNVKHSKVKEPSEIEKKRLLRSTFKTKRKTCYSVNCCRLL